MMTPPAADSPDAPRDARMPAGECWRCHGDSKVIAVDDATGCIRRRRECLQCGFRWTTREFVDPEKS